MSKLNKKGFTLAELLVVVGIIAVLVAISIPVFSSQTEKAKQAVDLANIRSAYAQVAEAAINEDTEIDSSKHLLSNQNIKIYPSSSGKTQWIMYVELTSDASKWGNADESIKSLFTVSDKEEFANRQVGQNYALIGYMYSSNGYRFSLRYLSSKVL